LLVLDRLQVAYICTILIYVCWRKINHIAIQAFQLCEKSKSRTWMETVLLLATGVPIFLLHGAQLIVKAPPSLPDLFPVLWSVVGCGFFVFAWSGLVWQLYEQFYASSFTTKVYDKSD